MYIFNVGKYRLFPPSFTFQVTKLILKSNKIPNLTTSYNKTYLRMDINFNIKCKS